MASNWAHRLERRLAELEEAKASQPPVVAAPVEDSTAPHEPDDDDSDDLQESTDVEYAPPGIGTSPAWAPVITEPARDFIRRDPSAKLDIEFPRVFEEDASARIRDITVAVESGMISHRRAAEMVARELGIERFDYLEERRQIEQERAAGMTAAPLGSGDTIVPDLPAQDEPEPKRRDLSSDAVHKFKRQMRQAESWVVKEVEYTPDHKPARVIEVASDGRVRRSRITRDAEGRVVGLEPEPDHEAQDT